MYHPLLSIQKVCQEKKIDPALILSAFLGQLAMFHKTLAMQPSNPARTVHDEVQNIIALSPLQEAPVRSLLDLFQRYSLAKWGINMNNAEVHRKAGLADAAAFETNAKILEALRLVLMDVAQEAEKEGLEMVLASKKRIKVN